MRVIQGISVYEDICIGRLFYYGRRNQENQYAPAKDCQRELQRYEQAIMIAWEQLQDVQRQSLKTVGEANAAIFEMQKLLLRDPEFTESAERMISQEKVSAECAVQTTGRYMAKQLEETGDPYIMERAQDVRDITARLLNILEGGGKETNFPDGPFILAAEDLLPSETVQFTKDKVIGFALCGGGVRSHTAILAKSMGIPALFKLGDELREEFDAVLAAIDGFEGVLYLDPDEETLNSMRRKKEEADRRRLLLNDLKGKRNVTGSGRSVKVFANVGTMADVWAARENDAGGIGLLRSELLYLGRREAPSEEDLFVFYRQVLERMEGKEVVIRTFDIGADKQVPYVGTAREENPALGLRAIRLGLRYPELLKTQLRALYRAGRYGCLRIMYPMITSPEEVCQLKTLEEQARQELSHRGETFLEQVPTGIMIETPAAALLAGELAKEGDFFSVGTNDLTQFTLALDRGSGYLEQFADPGHRAVLRLTEMAAKQAHEAGIWIGVCGDLAADTRFTERFLEMGIDEFSVAPGEILRLRQKIRGL